MKKILWGVLLLLVLAAFFSCAPGPNQLKGSADASGHLAGFWQGLWNGFIVLFTFIISLFNQNVSIYEVHNNGALYNLGFLLGVMIFFGGGGAGRAASWRNR